MQNQAQAGFLWTFEQYTPDGVLVSSRTAHNLIPLEGRNYLVSAGFANGVRVAPWYCGLFEGDYTPQDDDTAANIAARAMECMAYSGATRPEITFGDVAGGAINNEAMKVELTFTSDKTIYGGFLTSSPVKGGNTGVLVSVVRDGPEIVKAGRKLVITTSFNLFSV